jgi:ADP-ribose pyrophosphatase YjhB (NUDIX family)
MKMKNLKKIMFASGPVIVEDGKVLLNQHGDSKGWKFCGGRIKNEDENLIDIAKRRAMEEMGVELEILDDKPFLDFTRAEKNGEMTDIVLVHFLAKRVGEVRPGEEIKKWDWLEIDNLPESELSPNIIPALKHFGFLS